MEIKDRIIALLIDSDNISSDYFSIILDELSQYGKVTYRRLYGDFTNRKANGWKQALLDFSIEQIQQVAFTKGKNATDSKMIIDAMDILYSGNVDGFCIVSSDSDFTRLAVRLRESGMTVIGMGESKTPQPFISACNQFKYLDLLYEKKQEEAEEAAEPQAKRRAHREKNKPQKELEKTKKTINTIIEKFSDDDGWIFSGKLGDQLSKRLPDFDVRNFGFTKLTPFMKSLGCYEINKVSDGGGQKQIYFRVKEGKTK